MKSIQQYIFTLLLCHLFIGTAIAYVPQENTTQIESRAFKDDLKSKYNGRDFNYKNPEPVKEDITEQSDDESTKKAKEKSADTSGMAWLFNFLSNLVYLVYLIIPLAVFFIVKAILQMKKREKTISAKTERTLHAEEEENLTSLNLNDRLQSAIRNKNYRLAIRYYYLNVLKKMYEEKLIDYNPKKTNFDYYNELKSKSTKQHFSYLSYVYDYTWYGEFSVDEQKFLQAQQSFTNFIKSI